MAEALSISRAVACRFLLLHQGLLGGRRFTDPEEAAAYIRQAGSIQFDPISVCGRNPDLTLQSRVKNYRPEMLYNLLYRERRLVDYFDKELCIFPAEDWPHFARLRQIRGDWMRSHEQVAGARDTILEAITSRGALSSKDLDTGHKVDWFWGSSRLSRAVLEHLYYAGALGIHHKQGAVKWYDLIDRLLPAETLNAPDPHPDNASLHRFLMLRRAGALGLIWNKSSPAWLGFPDFKTPQRQAAFQRLLEEGLLVRISVAGIKGDFFIRKEDLPTLAVAESEDHKPRCELIAPLDPLLWDRQMIKTLFGFDYTWEIYVPAAKRRYGYYVLPILRGERFIGRVEPVFDRKNNRLITKGLWFEEDIKTNAATHDAVNRCLKRFERYHQAE